MDHNKNTNNPSITSERIFQDAEQKLSEFESQTIGLFNFRTANETMKIALNLPDPVYLYPVLFLENEFTIVFADPGAGKTVFCFDAAMKMAGDGHVVLYLDLELSKKQWQRRYVSDDGLQVVTFPETLYRIDFARLRKFPKGISYEDYFFESLIKIVDKTNARIIFVDNLTKLAASDTDTAKSTIPILERLNQLKLDDQLTIIVLEHNKKVDPTKPIHLNDLQGSKMKSNLVDSVFSIGKSAKAKNLRYIKQLKVRDGEIIFDSENVNLYEISKAKGYLSFLDVGYGSELDHLKPLDGSEKEETRTMVFQMKREGMSNRKIALQLGVSEGTIRKWLKKDL